MSELVLSRRDARRVAVRAQLLAEPRPDHLLDVVDHLTLLQLDPTAAVAPSADVVLWSRLGGRYDPGELDQALDARRLVELRGTIRPAADIALFRAEMDAWPGAGELRFWQKANAEWVEANEICRTDILRRLHEDGPLPTSALPDSCAVPWRSTGWTDARNVDRLLDFMVQRGEVAVAGRENGERLWDLADRVYPELPPVPHGEAVSRRDARRLTALGIARVQGAAAQGGVGDAGMPVRIDGVRGGWKVDPAYLDQPFRGRAALLSPLDRLVFDRARMAELFEFDYVLEMYKPRAKRRWGYWAMPVLYGDRLVGKLDATADRRDRVLRVDHLFWDVEPSATMRRAVDREIVGLARWLGLELVRPG